MQTCWSGKICTDAKELGRSVGRETRGEKISNGVIGDEISPTMCLIIYGNYVILILLGMTGNTGIDSVSQMYAGFARGQHENRL